MEIAKGRKRIVRIACAVLAVACAPAALAQTPRLLTLYPLHGIDWTPPQVVAEAQSLLESAAMGLARRAQNVYPSAPLVMRPACGRVPETACLVRQAKEGVIVWGFAHQADGVITVSLRAVDARGKVYGPVRGAVDAVIQNSEPFLLALLALDARMGIATEPPVASAPRLRPGERPRRAAGLQSKPLPANPPMRFVPPAVARRRASQERVVSSGWRTFGKALVGGGVALAAAGAGVGYLDRRLSDSLEEKFQAGTLTAADAGSYRRVDRYNTAATVLLVTGAAAATTGFTLWVLAPDGSPGSATRVGVSGRF